MFFKKLMVAIVVALGFAFPVVADEAKVRAYLAQYEQELESIEAEWEAERSHFDFIEMHRAFDVYAQKRTELIAQFKAADPVAYTAFLEAELNVDLNALEALEEKSEAYMAFVTAEDEAHKAVTEAEARDLRRAEVREARAREIRKIREAQARDDFIANLAGLAALN